MESWPKHFTRSSHGRRNILPSANLRSASCRPNTRWRVFNRVKKRVHTRPAALDGEVIVVAAYKVNGDVFEVVDVEGPYAYPEGGTGKYKWSLDGRTLSFSLIEDNNPGRRKGFAQPFIRQE
jgi:hypothetical protein